MCNFIREESPAEMYSYEFYMIFFETAFLQNNSGRLRLKV